MRTPDHMHRFGRRGRTAALAATVLGVLVFHVSSALANETGPRWTVTAVSRPTNFAPGATGREASYRVTVTNTGGSPTDGSPITITDELPNGLALDPMGASGEDELIPGGTGSGGDTRKLECVLSTCTYGGVVVPDDTLTLIFPVDVAAGAPSMLTNVVRVLGGGAPTSSIATPTTISFTPAAFGLSPGGATTALSSTQAGAHPDLTTSIAFNTVNSSGTLAGDFKDTTDDLPPGFAGDLVDTASCSAALFSRRECPISTQVGVTTITLVKVNEPSQTYLEPVYNLAPNAGEVAKLGFTVVGFFDIQGQVSVRPGDYGLQTSFHNTNATLAEVNNVSLTIWGVPAASSHDPLRWQLGVNGSPVQGAHFGVSSGAPLTPFFTNPTACGTQGLNAEFTVDSWQRPDVSVSEKMPFGPITGCDRLGMEPSLTAEATTSKASAASGLDLVMKIPQTYDNPAGLATSTLQKAVVTLPEGMTVNPSAGAGLGACTPTQYTEEGAQFIPGQGCPSESKLGTVKIVTPALKEEVTGSVFLAQPYDNPFSSLLALYIVARIPDRGVLVKAAGEVSANPLTGQLVTTFDTANSEAHDGLPPLPFSLFTFSFRQGATSPLVTPPTCGNYTITAALTPWSDPTGTPLTPLIPPFPINTGFDGGACPSGGTPPFSPQVTVGAENPNAGSYAPLGIHIARNDGEQEITGFTSELPPGLTANLTGVPFCPEADIALARTKAGAEEEAEPSCPAASQIGHTVVGTGVGSVLAQTPGKLYMAGPFEGAPFSVVAITSAHVGPFDLGTVVVHLPLQINPETAAVTIPAGAADQIPHIIKGIVVHVRDIRVYVDRPHFMITPTNCDPLSFSTTVLGSGQSFADPSDDDAVTVADPFRMTACQALRFAPGFAVSTSGRTSKRQGASLHVRLTYPSAPQGSEANIHLVKVDLPKQLPSRLTTLQKACTATQFNTNPAGCPAASFIGHAKAITPILPVPLEGPAIFVSHGGEAFPSLEIVLQGYGVTIDLVGSTFISKQGITSSTFKTVPDQPVTSFELTLPQGPYSALAANGNLCTSKLAMPTEFVAQNGAKISQFTPITVTGCPKTKALTRAQKLTAALKLCRKDKNHAKRASCERAARKRYAPTRSKQKKQPGRPHGTPG